MIMFSLVFTHTSIEKQELNVNGRNDLTIGVKKKVSALDEVQYIAFMVKHRRDSKLEMCRV